MTMKVEQIMIGDSVLYNNIICKVYSIQSPLPREEERFNNKCIVTLWCNGLIDVVIDDIEPIPLTEDILKAFGFEKLGESDYEYIYTRNNVPFVICKRELTCPYIKIARYFFCNVNFANELQHALRLCGLNDLADNFKV